uniref:Uncharacterized protein n=1 Tax=Anguilla anguilla TaxID=7936 RepID=A0A0E9VGT3_ANGAN
MSDSCLGSVLVDHFAWSSEMLMEGQCAV